MKLEKATSILMTFTSLFNFYVFVIWFISILMKMQAPKSDWLNVSICLIAAITIFMYQKKKYIY